MTNQNITKTFFAVVDTDVRDEILAAVATHYDITPAAALDELTCEGAEHLLDYLTGGMRTATHVLMRRHSLIDF